MERNHPGGLLMHAQVYCANVQTKQSIGTTVGQCYSPPPFSSIVNTHVHVHTYARSQCLFTSVVNENTHAHTYIHTYPDPMHTYAHVCTCIHVYVCKCVCTCRYSKYSNLLWCTWSFVLVLICVLCTGTRDTQSSVHSIQCT